MKKIYTFLSMLLFIGINCYGQIGINIDKPRGIIDFSENSGGFVLPKSKSPENCIRIPGNSKGLALPGTVVYDTQRNCMRVTSETGKWSECIGTVISGAPVLNAIGEIKGIGIQNNVPKGLLDLNNNKEISDMGLLVPQVNSVNGLPTIQVGSFVFDKTEKCLKFVFKDYDDKNKWSGCMNFSISTDSDEKEYEKAVSSSISKRSLNLTGAIGIGTEDPKGILDASNSSQPMILPLLDNALISHNILTSGTLVYDKSVRAPRIVYKDNQGKLRWSSRLPGANYCGHDASNGGGKIYSIKEGVVKLPNNYDNFFLNNSLSNRTIAFWVKGSPSDTGAVYAESWLLSTYRGRDFIGFNNEGKLKIYIKPDKHFAADYTSSEIQLDDQWHYFVFEKTGKQEITIYKDNVLLDTFDYSKKTTESKLKMTATLGCQKKCCSSSGNPSYNIFSGTYTVISFWKKNLNEEERIRSQYGFDISDKDLLSAFIPSYGNHILYDCVNKKKYKIGDSKVKIVPADDLPIPFGRNIQIFDQVSDKTGEIKLTNEKINDEFIITPIEGTAKRVVIYESLDSPTNAESDNLYNDFFGIHIEEGKNFKYNIQYKRKLLECEDDLTLYTRNYHQGFKWTKQKNSSLKKTKDFDIFSLENLSGEKEFIIGYEYN